GLVAVAKRFGQDDFMPKTAVTVAGHDIDEHAASGFQRGSEIANLHDMRPAKRLRDHDYLPAVQAGCFDGMLRIRPFWRGPPGPVADAPRCTVRHDRVRHACRVGECKYRAILKRRLCAGAGKPWSLSAIRRCRNSPTSIALEDIAPSAAD